MAPLITLLASSIVARIVGWLGVAYVDSWIKAIAVGLAAMFVLTGVAHFV
ncbi:MAG: DoxX family protein, partial [Mycobacterium sp.]